MTHPRKGFSLPELLVAAGILTAVFLLLMEIFPSVLAAVHQDKDRMIAGQLAQRYVEEGRSRSYTDMLAFSPTTVGVPATVSGVSSSQEFLVDVQITPVGAVLLADSELARISVTVQWTRKGASGTAVLTALRLESLRLRDL